MSVTYFRTQLIGCCSCVWDCVTGQRIRKLDHGQVVRGAQIVPVSITTLVTDMTHGMYITIVGIQPNNLIGLQEDQTMGHERERYLL